MITITTPSVPRSVWKTKRNLYVCACACFCRPRGEFLGCERRRPPPQKIKLMHQFRGTLCICWCETPCIRSAGSDTRPDPDPTGSLSRGCLVLLQSFTHGGVHAKNEGRWRYCCSTYLHVYHTGARAVGMYRMAKYTKRRVSFPGGIKDVGFVSSVGDCILPSCKKKVIAPTVCT